MNRFSWIAIAVLAVILAFGAGFGWQYARAHRLEDDVARLRSDLAFARLEATLAAAAVQAQRGSHETSRMLASDFFDGLQASAGSAPPDLRPTYDSILGQRDAVITMLSRAEARSAEMMAELAERFREARVGVEP